MSSGAGNKLRILTFTTLYPNAAKPQHGVFVENRLRQLISSGEISSRVLAPVSYFPFSGDRFGRYATFAKAPLSETRFGIEIDHPRFLTIPKLGMTVAPFLLYASARFSIARLLRAGWTFDVIDAHYFYPDGVAAVMLGRAFGIPVTVTARGTDVNVVPNYSVPRRLILWAAEHADGLIAVSNALAMRLADLGIDRSRVTVLRNGVDATLFRPTVPFRNPEHARQSPLAVSVGNLVPLKGHDLAISALTEIRELGLWIVGGGPERRRLEALAKRLGVDSRVSFLGVLPHEKMPEVYSAADVLLLASEREGWPNVLLEAMACGARVITTNVSDVPDVVTGPAAGIWIRDRTVSGLVQALREVLATPMPREQTRAHALNFSWQATTRGQIDLFRSIRATRHAGGP
jgi:glycosyltransferase involved in cell wall biosynthesis